MRTNTTDKASVKNGRARSGGEAYNANHNTLEATRQNQAHIATDRIHLNQYVQYNADGTEKVIKGGKGGFNAKAHERKLYEHFYGEGLEAKNERYTKTGHGEDKRTMQDLYTNPKTAPLETILQVGSTDSVIAKEVRADVLAKAWEKTVKELRRICGGYIVPADAALHMDEAQPHIHFRSLLMAKDKFGHWVPNQTQALEAIGFTRPDPSKPRSRYNNALISFTDVLRESFYQNCERFGIKIDREVQSHSKRQVSILEHKCEQIKEEIAAVQKEAAKSRQEAQEARKQAVKELDILETKQLFVEMEVEQQEKKAAQSRQEAQDAAITEQMIKNQVQVLQGRVAALERSQAAIEQDNKELKVENDNLRQNNSDLQQEHEQLQSRKNTIAQQSQALESQLAALQKQKEQAEAEKAQAEQARAAAVDALDKIEQHQKNLYKNSPRTLRKYGTMPAETIKSGWGKNATQEVLPARTVVATEDLEHIYELAKYHKDVDYNRETIQKLDRVLTTDKVKQLQARVAAQEGEIQQLESQNKGLHKTAQRQAQELTDRKEFMQRYGVEHIYETEQQYTQEQSQDFEM